LTNITGTCAQGFLIRNAKNVTLKGIKLDGITGPPLYTENVQGSGLDGAAPYVPPAASPKPSQSQ
jgi:hypothetical protein